MSDKADPNIVELRQLSDPSKYGDMLRLASTMKFLKYSSFISPSQDLWSYLKSQGFQPDFVESVAKPFWKKACSIVEKIPYRYAITEGGCESERRLTAHLLREVCREMTQTKT